MASIEAIDEDNSDHVALDILEDPQADNEDQDETHTHPELQQESVDNRDEVIIGRSFSGDHKYAAELVETDTHLFIKLWLRPDPDGGRPAAALQCRVSVDKPILASTIVANNAYDISLSYDASWIALVDGTTDYLPTPVSGQKHPPGAFRIFEVVKGNPSSQWPLAFALLDTARGLPRLTNYYGLGEFHIADDVEDGNFMKEVFITCNGEAVQVYGIHGGWKYLHTISLDHPKRTVTRFNVAAEMISSCQGRLFAWVVHGTDMVAVYDMEQGSMVSSVTRTCLDRGQSAFKTALDISDNGVLLAVNREGTLTTHFTKDGTLHRVLCLPIEFSNAGTISFIRGNSQLIIRPRRHGTSELDKRGLLINVLDLSILGIFRTPARGHLQALRADDLDVTPYHPTILACDDACLSTTSRLCERPREVTMSGLHFQVELQSTVVVLPWESQDLQSVVVTITSLDELSSKTFNIPPANDNEDWWRYETAVFLEERGQLIVEGQGVVMIWKLPTSIDDDFILDHSWLIGPKNAEWATCPHSQVYYRPRHTPNRRVSNDNDHLPMWTPIRPDMNESSSEDRAAIVSFVKGIDIVIYMSLRATEAFKRSIFQFIGRQMTTKAFGTNALAMVIGNWTREHYNYLEQFMAAFLVSPFGVMHPSTGSITYVRVVLDTGKKEPRSVGIARILIDHCIRQARDALDVEYLVQIMRSLPILLVPRAHSDLALHTLRQLAYFPVSSRKFIINHHTIAHPPKFRLWPWGKHASSLHHCKDPILQLSKKRVYDKQNDNFTRELFVAPFDMLWEVRRNTESSEASRKLAAVEPLRLAQQVFRAILYKLTPERNTPVRCYDFDLDMLDNPALAALVEYKWNTIGFKYWLVRFLCQCCFYLLVVTTVLMQAYDNDLKLSEGIYITIISYSTIFFYLEFIQCFRDWGRYMKSMYNILDLLAFGFPLAAAVNQLLISRGITSLTETTIQLNAGLFGFSVPLISLHFLFELRVLMTVSQFVVIITRIISRIRVFFIMFFAGIIAFTIAILHVIFSCPSKDKVKCGDRSTEQLPVHFFKAFTATYFLMGGRYDPITDDLGSNNWAFQVLMIVYFFFTVILMLNVLIALLNVAYNSGDISWRQVWLRNRMRVVENAENMSYRIPGFREAHNWFPSEIYYSVTHEQAKAYKERWDEGGYKDTLQEAGVDAGLKSREANISEAIPRPGTPESETLRSPTLVATKNNPQGESAATSSATFPDVADSTVEELDVTPKKQGDPFTYLTAKLEKQMNEQQAMFESQIEKMDAQFQHLQDSSNAQIRQLIEQLARLHPGSVTDTNPETCHP